MEDLARSQRAYGLNSYGESEMYADENKCDDGYEYHSYADTCHDVDECEKKLHDCDTVTQVFFLSRWSNRSHDFNRLATILMARSNAFAQTDSKSKLTPKTCSARMAFWIPHLARAKTLTSVPINAMDQANAAQTRLGALSASANLGTKRVHTVC